MVEILCGIIKFIFGSNSRLATVVVSMFPIIELKGAIPVGMSVEFWGENALTSSQAFVYSLIGSCLVVPIIALIFTPIINWMKNTRLFKNLASFIENKINKSTHKIENNVSNKDKIKNKTLLKILGVFTFVAIPLPLTGVWTGTCIGVALGLKFYQTVLSVILGNIVAGFLVTMVCNAFPQFTTLIFLGILLLLLIVLIFEVIKILIKNKKTKIDG